MTLIIFTDDALLIYHIEAGLAEHCPVANVIGHCYSVEAGMEAVTRLGPDVILLDSGMPGMQKYSLLTMLATAGFIVLVLTASKTLYRKLNRQGIAVMMSEPWDPVLLARFLNSLKI